MAVLVFYNRGHSRDHRHNCGLGDCITVLANNQAPGNKLNLPSSKASFVRTAGTKESWQWLKEIKWDMIMGADGVMENDQIRHKRRYRSTLFNTQPQAWLDLANQYQTAPFMTKKNVEASIIEKTGPPGPGD